MMMRVRAAVLVCAALFAAAPLQAQPAAIRVDGRIALASLESLCDGHLQATLDGLAALASTREAGSAAWAQIETPLRALAAGQESPGSLWFATPDGTYWTVDGGRQPVKLADRPYFARLLAGRRVVGDLVVSRSTGVPVAVVAVPVLDAAGKTIGALGASIKLDRLSAMLKREMDAGPDVIFFSLDARGTVGITATPSLIMRTAGSISPELEPAFAKILSTKSGTVTYTLHGQPRTVIYRTSSLTGWRYAFGVVGS